MRECLAGRDSRLLFVLAFVLAIPGDSAEIVLY